MQRFNLLEELPSKRHERNPLKRRELYIVGGKHGCPFDDLEQKQEVMRFVRLQNTLIGNIAIKRKCTGFFADGCEGWSAKLMNERTMDFFNADENGRREILRNMVEFEDSVNECGYSSTASMIVRVMDAGIPIVHLQTEDALDYVEILNGKIPQEEFEKLRLAKMEIEATMGKEDMDVLFFTRLYGRRDWARIIDAVREPGIFRNICEYGHERNILFIGRSHRLREFKGNGHDFIVHRVDFFDSKSGWIAIRGTMPEILRDEFESLKEDDKKTRIEVDFR